MASIIFIPFFYRTTGVGDEPLSKLPLSLRYEVQDSPDWVFSELGLHVKVNDPVVVVEKVGLVFQAVLEGPGLVQSTRLCAVGAGNHRLSDPGVGF